MIQNGIPFSALVLETIVIVLMFGLSANMFAKYKARKRQTTFLLFLSILCLGLAVTGSAIGKFLDYFSATSDMDIRYSGFTINIGYAFVALGNIFLYKFAEIIFLSNSEGRITIITVLNSVIIGLILGTNSFDEDAYSQIFYYVIGMVILSTFIYILIFYLAFKERRTASDNVSKWGFTFIGLFALLLFLMFVMFIADLSLIQITGDGYNLPYYLGWSSGGLASVCGYLGYINPQWFRNLVGGETE